MLLVKRSTIFAWSAGVVVLMAIIIGVWARLAAEPLSDNEVAFYVNGYPVSVAETLETHVRTKSYVTAWRDAFNRMLPDDDPRITGDHFSYEVIYDGKSPVPASLVAERKWEFDMWEAYGPDTMTLAELVAKYAEYTYAMDQGFAMSDGEVDELVEKLRREYEARPYYSEVEFTDLATGKTVVHVEEVFTPSHIDSEIAAIGEDTYWDEVLPKRLRIQSTAAKWRQATVDDLAELSHTSIYETVISLNREALANTEVRMAEGFDLETDIHTALRYLDERYAGFEQMLVVETK